MFPSSLFMNAQLEQNENGECSVLLHHVSAVWGEVGEGLLYIQAERDVEYLRLFKVREPVKLGPH